MSKFRKKPVVIEADQWFKNGDLAVVELKDDVADLKAEVDTLGLSNINLGGELGLAQARVAELEAEVAAREARCVAYVKAIREVIGALDTGGEMDYALKEVLDIVLACPDLAAARLLAAGALAEAWVAYDDARLAKATAWHGRDDPTDTESEPARARELHFAVEDMWTVLGCKGDTYRAAKAAEENTNET